MPASAPVEVDGTLVLYTVRDQTLHLTGVDPADGRHLWSPPATPSVRPRGMALQVQQVDGAVVHLAPAPRDRASTLPADVILRDPRTGSGDRQSSQAVSHADLPEPCPGATDRVCVTVQVDGDDWSLLALDEDGNPEALPATGVQGWMAIGPLGLSRWAMDGTRIGREVDGELVWETSTTEIFGDNQSTDTGWAFQSLADDAVLAGTVGIRLSADEGSAPWLLSDYLTVGLDPATGEPLWRAEATSIFCDADLTEDDADPLLACHWRSGEMDVVGRTTYRDLDVDLVRLDPLKGQTLWSVPLGETRDGDEPGLPVLRAVSAHEVAVAAQDAVLVIDTETGAAREATARDTTWVEDRAVVDVESSDVGGTPFPDDVVTAGLYRPEAGDGNPTDRVPWPLPPLVGVEVDIPAQDDADRTTTARVVAGPTGLTAYGAP